MQSENHAYRRPSLSPVSHNCEPVNSGVVKVSLASKREPSLPVSLATAVPGARFPRRIVKCPVYLESE